ncbi:Predicted arabinose efflux permease, MFS family [Franzmannia pantelleriensis]|uniref:Predicted arabinose efflux permease, MFS family n=1 Tax=Franzmannia pantelleriensis TaxID=48727 RepID=A0A1G9I859_9GAMM|nr:YbfB/YjiJ family MFS transporter [Halomonas pantelleriensis]SDL21014.1 Predicted arabinose efflux permease, MFS family [Halomonas pantelleriensis]
MIDKRDIPALLTGVMATLAGIGLARFAYTPLLPAVIEAQWFSASAGAYLGAANLLGYLFGALSGHSLSERYPPRALLGICFAAIALSFLLCAWPASFAWFFVWRLAAGIAGGILMVVGPSLALTATPVDRRAHIGALAFAGIGLGALLSAWVVPLLLETSLMATWLALGVLSLAVGVIGDRGLARLTVSEPASSEGASTPRAHTGVAIAVLLVIGAYVLDGAGYVPHTLFWVDYLAREHALGHPSAALQWGLFGLGAVCGPLLASAAARRLGWQRGLALAFLAKATAVALPLLSLDLLSRSISSLVVGAMIPGIVALTSGRLAELVGPAAHKRLWGRATAAFAAAQAASGYGMSALYAGWGSYTPLFAIGSVMLAGGFVLVLLSRGLQAHHGAFSTPPRRH